MIRIFLPLICAVLGFAAASCTQSEAPLAPAAEAPAAAHPTSHASAATDPLPDPQQANAAGQSTPGAKPTASGAPQPPATPPDQPVSDQALSSDEVSSTTPAPQSASDTNSSAPASARAERRATTLIGMSVVAVDGSALGEVKDIIFDRQGRATHVVISYDGATAPASDSKLTAMPWDAAMASIRDSRLLLDDAQLRGAPSFAPDAWPDLDDPAWSATTDAYWRKAVQAAIAAHPGAPIDSTSRQRERPPRDSN